MAGARPPFAMLKQINDMLVNAGYPKSDGTIVKRLEQALAERGKDPGLKPRFEQYIVERRSSIEWLSELSYETKQVLQTELDNLEDFIKSVFG